MPDIILASKMYDAIDAADERAEPFRRFKEEAVRELTGRFYNHDDGQQRPMNLIARNILTLQAHLAHRNPKHTVETDFLPLRGEAQVRGILLDEISKELDRIRITRLQLLSAMLGPYAITKIGLRAGDDMVKINGKEYNPGQTYIQAIDLDDHIFDHQARCLEEMQWEGHRYRVSKQIALECGLFDPAVIESLPGAEYDTEASGRRRRSDKISKQAEDRDMEAVEMIELVDIAFYGEGTTIIATLPGTNHASSDYLLINEFQGPMRGPYERLEFLPLPNQAYGLPPVSLMREQSEAMNKLFAKMVDQILRTKRMLVGNRASRDDLDTVQDAEDGQVAEVDDVDSLKNVDFGGLSQDFPEFAQQLGAWSNMQYVNIDLATGQSGGTDKATIYQGMSSNLNVLIDDLQNTHEQYETRVSEQLHWYLDTDPLRTRGGTMRMPGGETLQVVFDPMTKRGQYQDFTTKIQYGSMLRQDPQVKAQNLKNLMDTMMESMQLTMATGGAWNSTAVARIFSHYMGFEELDEVINDPVLQQQLMQRMMQLPQQTPGQVAGPSKYKPQSIQGPRPQPQVGGGFARPQQAGMQRQPQMAGV